jgi:hypothetical protein
LIVWKSKAYLSWVESVNRLQTGETEYVERRIVKKELIYWLYLGIQDCILNAMPMIPQMLQTLKILLKIVVNTGWRWE